MRNIKIPEHCLSCLNFTKNYKCRAFTTLMNSDCQARTVDPEEIERRILAIEEYGINRGLNMAYIREEAAEATVAAGEKRTSEIMAVMYEDRKRGSRGGGGEQEKAPNKPRPKKPVVWPWEGW